ncbi:MAG: hypothetical protein HYU64_20815 [Armatimonadetes bacterium]|nr:hypothetical protein [Armatimonadota bacterium]
MPETHSHRLFLFFLGLGLVLALVMLVQRWGIEKANNTVELVMDYDALKDLCRAEGEDRSSVLAGFKEAGITSLALSEITLRRLRETGQIVLIQGAELLALGSLADVFHPTFKRLLKEKKISLERQYLLAPPDVRGHLVRRLRGVFGRRKVAVTGDVIELVGKPDLLEDVGLGLSWKDLDELRKTTFYLIPRLENKDNLRRENVDFLFSELFQVPRISCIVFAGLKNEVLGYPNLMPVTASHFSTMGLQFGYLEAPEASKVQKGTQTLAYSNQGNVIRVQAIPVLQMARLTPQNATDMWLLGVRERNIRMLYLRPFFAVPDGEDLIAANLAYVRNLSKELNHQGKMIGKATGLPALPWGIPAVLCMGAGVGAGVVLLARRLLQIPLRWELTLWSLFPLFSLAASLVHRVPLWQKGMALIASIVFPVLAFLYSAPWLTGKERSFFASRNHLAAVKEGLYLLWRVSFFSFLGAAYVGAFLSDRPFMLTLDQFRGVKFALVGPVLLILGIYFLGRHTSLPGRDLRTLGNELAALFGRPVLLGHALSILAVASVGFFLLMRSGNEPGISVSDTERSLRSWLEDVLIVRPRFKEFALGHPALACAGFLAAIGESPALWVFLALGVVAQADIFNTFSHAHTPLWVTCLRLIIGLVIGSAVGAAAAGLLSLLLRKPRDSKSSGGPH